MISPIDIGKKSDKIQQTLVIINAQHYNSLENDILGKWSIT